MHHDEEIFGWRDVVERKGIDQVAEPVELDLGIGQITDVVHMD